jgi:hypothetical protein
MMQHSIWPFRSANRGRAVLSSTTGPAQAIELWAARRPASVAAFVLLIPGLVTAAETVQTLAARSAIVVIGTVLRAHASAEPTVPASEKTIVIRVDRMLAGAEIAGNQAGRTATVILSQVGNFKVGATATFYGNPRAAGATLTMQDQGETAVAGETVAQADVERSVQARRDRPVQERLVAASTVFRGRVEGIERLEPSAKARPSAPPRSEHDPEWQVATVRVTSAIRGGSVGETATVIFAGSRDIEWFNAPKLAVGQDAVFIAHKPSAAEDMALREFGAAFLGQKTVQLLTDPNDLLPASEEVRVRNLAQATRGSQP